MLFECTLYVEERGRWRATVRDLKDGMDEYEIRNGSRVLSEEMEEKNKYMRVMWNCMQRQERSTFC